jgi:hypothetical protein
MPINLRYLHAVGATGACRSVGLVEETGELGAKVRGSATRCTRIGSTMLGRHDQVAPNAFPNFDLAGSTY